MVNKLLVLTVCLGLNFLLSDLIILYRTCILWRDNRIVQGISGLVFVATLALLLADLFTTQPVLSAYANNVEHVPIAIKNTYGGIAILISLGLNIWATVLISVKLWQYGNTVSKANASLMALTYKSLSLLSEYGALYCIIQMIFTVFSVYKASSQSAAISSALDQIVVQVSGIYPTTIIVLVCLRKVEETNGSVSELSSRPNGALEHMQFADAEHK